MALIRKRKLTKRQTRRIKQQQHIATQVDDADLLEGLVVAHYGKQLDVLVLSTPVQLQPPPTVAAGEPEPFWQPVILHDVWRCHTRTNLNLIATGDNVRWLADSNTGLGCIEAVYPRQNIITRPDRFKKVKAVAANVDVLVIVFAPVPVPSARLIDRYLVVCHHVGVTPLLVLNKADLLQQDDASLNLLKGYEQLGYATLVTQKTADLSPLQQQLAQKNVIFAGQSGVGKSSLINQLLPKADQRVNSISTNSQLGQHTTTTSKLLPLQTDDLSAGAIIDSPGIREYGLWHLQPEDIMAGFVEMQPLLGQCRFRDCNHTVGTPGCALQQAVVEGHISQARLDSLLALMAESQQEK